MYECLKIVLESIFVLYFDYVNVKGKLVQVILDNLLEKTKLVSFLVDLIDISRLKLTHKMRACVKFSNC